MKKSRFKPDEYLSSKSDPRYKKLEIRFALRLIFRKPIRHRKKSAKHAAVSTSLNEKEAKASFYLNEIRNGQNQRGMRLSFTDRAEDYAIDAVKAFGIDALRLSGPDEQV